MSTMTKDEFVKGMLSEFAKYTETAEEEHIHLSTFLMQRAYCEHQKMVLMAGDLGQAFSKIGHLEMRLNDGDPLPLGPCEMGEL